MLTNKLSCYIFIILGHWLGNQSLPIFTVIDTPGFGNDLIEEERTIEGKKPVADFLIVTFCVLTKCLIFYIMYCLIFLGLVNMLKDEIKFIHAFVIAFKQSDNRMTASLRSMIGLFQKMFGDRFWKNAMLGRVNTP